MDNAAFKPKTHKNMNEIHDPNFQYQIRPKPRTRRKSKPPVLSNELPQNRLYPAISESSMCYPIPPLPPAIPIEHHASVSFLPIYQPSPCCSSYQCCPHNKPQQSPMTSHINLNKKPPMHTKYLNNLNGNESFTSLPPAIPYSCEDSPTRRRFSDPGLGNDDISITSDETREADEIQADSGELSSVDFEEELMVLKRDYCKMSRELNRTKKELAFVKSVVQNQNVHSPLLITDIIKEIQNAADSREEAFISRVQALVEQSSTGQSDAGCASCQSVLKRLDLVESQLKQLSLHSDHKINTNLFEELKIDGGVKSSGYTGSNDTGYTSSNGRNPFTFSRESSASPSTEL